MAFWGISSLVCSSLMSSSASANKLAPKTMHSKHKFLKTLTLAGSRLKEEKIIKLIKLLLFELRHELHQSAANEWWRDIPAALRWNNIEGIHDSLKTFLTPSRQFFTPSRGNLSVTHWSSSQLSQGRWRKLFGWASTIQWRLRISPISHIPETNSPCTFLHTKLSHFGFSNHFNFSFVSGQEPFKP